MRSTFIIYDDGSKEQAEIIEQQLSIERISYQSHENEMGYHDWLTREFKTKNIQRILIPLSLPSLEENTEGLLLGLHIRLNYELPIEKRNIPIVFITNLSIDNILAKSTFDSDNNPQNLLFSEGIYISSTDIDEIKEKLGTAKSVKDYNLFLRQLNIRRKATVGGHDIANAWGCYKLARVVGISEAVFANEAIAKHLKQLYAKYLICVNESYNDSKMSYIDLQPISCLGKRVLFIDDKSDEGWEILMHKIFKSAGNGFVCVDSTKYKTDGSFTDYEGFISECKSYIGQYWDLIIIDIRLNPNTEDIDTNNIAPTEFSGYKLIDAFLNKNKGYQILVSTASNKIWNVNAALKRGAKGYYIKESPEFNYPVAETKKQYESLKESIQACFDNSYLQDIFSSIERIKGKLQTSTFEESIKKQLDLAFYLIYRAETEEQFAFAYVALYQIIEIITDELITKEQLQTNPDINKWKLIDGTYIHEYKWDSQAKSYQDLGEAQSGKEPFPQWKKMAGLVLQEWTMQNGNSFVRNLYFLIEKRNGFIHDDKTILDKQDKNTGKYLNHDIFDKSGFISLFDSIKTICLYL
jgi:DNA-binding NarL/FixJ family response regulator